MGEARDMPEIATGTRPKLVAPAAARARLAALAPQVGAPAPCANLRKVAGTEQRNGSAPPDLVPIGTPSPSETAQICADATEVEIAAKKAAAAERHNRVRAILEPRWPRLFGWAQPLAVGIHLQLQAALGDEIDTDDLGKFLKFWTRRAEYHAALARGVRRQNLDGSDAGPVLDNRFPLIQHVV